MNRLLRDEFFARFEKEHAVQYFYEPFLAAFDPELRKQLGVWYTPPQIVKYMVERVDQALRTELGLADGLADQRVIVLDPCCGTGSFLIEVLRRIHRKYQDKGADDLTPQRIREAATKRIFGFELLTAPFVVSHLQIGMLLESAEIGAPLPEGERAGVYLTNALTGWEPAQGPKQQVMWPEMEYEREAAGHVKREQPVLVILGNPPYSGFAGVAMGEERDLSTAYRNVKRVAKPQGQGLNELYVRFFRMAERKIVEGTKRGVVCFISNYSWLDSMSHTGMRERYLEVFDSIWVDCLNGDKYKTGKLTPWGDSDPSVFSTPHNREGIQVGTAIALLVKRLAAKPGAAKPSVEAAIGDVRFRHWWGKAKLEELRKAASAAVADNAYEVLQPDLALDLALTPGRMAPGYTSWPSLPELFPVSSPGVNTSRDGFLVDIDRSRLEGRIKDYFDPGISDDQLGGKYPGIMDGAARYDSRATRAYLLQRGMKPENIVRYCYRPFDLRWLYWEPESKLLDEKRDELFKLAKQRVPLFTSREKRERLEEGLPFIVTHSLADRHLTRPGSMLFSPLINPGSLLSKTDADTTEKYWYHTLAIGCSSAYLRENASALWLRYPHIPLPADDALLSTSVKLGQQVAVLLDIEAVAPGVAGPLGDDAPGQVRPELAAIGLVRIKQGALHDASRLKLAEHWGHFGQGRAVMPGKGRITARVFSDTEQAVLGDHTQLLGGKCKRRLKSAAVERRLKIVAPSKRARCTQTWNGGPRSGSVYWLKV